MDNKNVDNFVDIFPTIAKENIKLKENVQKWTGKNHLKPTDYIDYRKHQEKIAESSGIYMETGKKEKKVYLEDRVEALERIVEKLTKQLSKKNNK